LGPGLKLLRDFLKVLDHAAASKSSNALSRARLRAESK